ncbi:hypothetical protein NQ315_006868 [Exocentrus adspersus]|uniref:Uncharacterized protein n=1 Tax=Exocentrus adspersus TaxID=1586481 RepID=A0AAV8WCP0_9CUCU|nr:hypothetical protein NQ315_006868 [Exocentrus adspersus]
MRILFAAVLTVLVATARSASFVHKQIQVDQHGVHKQLVIDHNGVHYKVTVDAEGQQHGTGLGSQSDDSTGDVGHVEMHYEMPQQHHHQGKDEEEEGVVLHIELGGHGHHNNEQENNEDDEHPQIGDFQQTDLEDNEVDKRQQHHHGLKRQAHLAVNPFNSYGTTQQNLEQYLLTHPDLQYALPRYHSMGEQNLQLPLGVHQTFGIHGPVPQELVHQGILHPGVHGSIPDELVHQTFAHTGVHGSVPQAIVHSGVNEELAHQGFVHSGLHGSVPEGLVHQAIVHHGVQFPEQHQLTGYSNINYPQLSGVLGQHTSNVWNPFGVGVVTPTYTLMQPGNTPRFVPTLTGYQQGQQTYSLAGLEVMHGSHYVDPQH